MMVTLFGLSKFSHRISTHAFSTSPKIAIVGTGPAVSLLPKNLQNRRRRKNLAMVILRVSRLANVLTRRLQSPLQFRDSRR